jgi:putative RecB family exonuclease
MSVYSHSRLSTYEDCPLRYKLQYIDNIKRATEGVEAYLGSRVHDTLERCYQLTSRGRVPEMSELIAYYDAEWHKNWHDGIAIIRTELTQENYFTRGKKMIADYYRRFAPFDQDYTLGTEVPTTFSLDEAGKYRIRGNIDRLARTPEDCFVIHDYKTSGRLPSQEEKDGDRQLALYQIGVRQRWPDLKKVRLVWHYLAFDRDLVSERDEAAIIKLRQETMALIDRIEAATDFPPQESALCDWCDYPDLCPRRKHQTVVQTLPPNEYLAEPGVNLVNQYAALKEAEKTLDTEIDKVKAALIEYARREQVSVITGSGQQVRVKLETQLKFPGKKEDNRADLEKVIREAGVWDEVSQLDTAALTHVLEEGQWDAALAERVGAFRTPEETAAVYLAKRKGE